MKKSFQFSLYLLIGIACLVSSCSKEGPLEEFDNSTLKGIINSGGGFDKPSISESTTLKETETEERDGVTWECTTETKSIMAEGGGQNGFPLFSPNASVVYPGSLLQGKTLEQATPDIIAVKRAGGTISTDVADGNIESSFTIGSVTKSGVTTAINNIIAGSEGVVPANFDVKISNVQSREQFALALGLNVNSTFVDVEAKLNYKSDVETNTFVVNLNQSFYTMSLDIPTSLDEIFDPSVTADDLAKYVGPGNPATYISDVTYGRIYYMMIQSTSSKTEMDAAINASFSGIAVDVDGSVEVSYMKDLKGLSISVFAYGGNSESTLLTVGQSDLSKLTTLLSEASDIRSGKPLSYVVRSVYDNQIVATQLATQYDVTNCKPIGNAGIPPYFEHWTGEVIAKLGPVGAIYNTTGTTFYLINQKGDKYLISTTGNLEGPYSINTLGNEDCPFPSIGAACNLNGNQFENDEHTIQIFNATGTEFCYLLASGRYTSPRSIGTLAEGNNPFNGVGIGAVAFRSKDPLGPSKRYMFNKDGTKYTIYNNNPNSFGQSFDLYLWGDNYSVTDRIGAVGAACGFYIGNDDFVILFNKAGTKYAYWGDLDGDGHQETIGPFDL